MRGSRRQGVGARDSTQSTLSREASSIRDRNADQAGDGSQGGGTAPEPAAGGDGGLEGTALVEVYWSTDFLHSVPGAVICLCLNRLQSR